MSEEFDSVSVSEGAFSSFIPLTIALAGLVIFFAYQDYALNLQRVAYDQQLTSAVPAYNQAVEFAGKYKAVLKDLIDASQKDPAAEQILKEAVQAGWISFQPNTNASGAPSAPAAPSPAAPSK